MLRYLVRQSLLSIAKLFIFISIMFFFIQIMMPGDYVSQFAMNCDAECLEAFRVQLGLDLPIWQRYLQWLRQIVTLDLGASFTGEPIIEILKQIVPPTLLVFLIGTIISFLIGLWLGTRISWRGNKFFTRTMTLGGLTLFTSFPPWLTWLITYFFARRTSYVVMGTGAGLRVVPFFGLDRQLWYSVEIEPHTVCLYIVLTVITMATIFYVLKNVIEHRLRRTTPGMFYLLLIGASTVGLWYLFGIEALAFDLMGIAWIPLLTYVLLSFGETMLIMQSSMTDVMNEKYLTTARAIGLPETVVRDKHAARNAILPVLSRLVISLPYLTTGVVIIESAVSWPGMGTTMWNALYWQNIPVVMNSLLLIGLLSLIARLILDVISAQIDPRIQYGDTGIYSL